MAHPIDIHVGKRIRHRRWTLGMTQQHLAEGIGVKFQQVQKYETGANRVSASRLWEIASQLDVVISFFFDGYGEHDTHIVDVQPDPLEEKEAIALVRSYYAIPEAQRRRLFDLAKALSTAA